MFIKKLMLAALTGLMLQASTAMAAVDINSASVEELTTLPGIGPAKARAIVEDRDDNGPYQTVDQLERVSGIGPTMVERLRDDVAIGDDDDEVDEEHADDEEKDSEKDKAGTKDRSS